MKPLDELKLIVLIEKAIGAGAQPGVTLGIGDDCAALRPRSGRELIVTTDTLVDGVHFVRDQSTAADIGHRAAAVNLSDIAAMGGDPRHALLSLSIPKGITPAWLKKFVHQFVATLADGGAALVGGNVTQAGELSVSVTLMGDVKPEEMVTRDGASPGDLIYVTGAIGDAAFGLDILQGRLPSITKGKARLVKRYRRPDARLAWGRLLARRGLATAMIDISDGLLLDLGRIAAASGVGAEVELARIPLSQGGGSIIAEQGEQGWRRAITGGDDYELLFTVPPGKAKGVDRLISQGKFDAACIGQMVKGKSVALTLDGRKFLVGEAGHVHKWG